MSLSSRKVALITASSAGLGAATAYAFALAGFNTVINFNSNANKANELLQSIEQATSAVHGSSTDGDVTSQHRCIAIKADMSQSTDIRRLVDQTVSAMGRLDVVVSNQGWTQMRNFNDLDDNIIEADWDGCFNMNVKSHLWLFHAAKPHLQKTEGCFVSVASLAGVIPSGSSIAYSVTKAAQLHLIKTLAKISGPEVRVNSVSPGILLTEWGKRFPTEKLDIAKEKSVLKRLATVDDVVQQILCFANSRSITGFNAVIDGGWSLG